MRIRIINIVTFLALIGFIAGIIGLARDGASRDQKRYKEVHDQVYCTWIEYHPDYKNRMSYDQFWTLYNAKLLPQ